jgi:ribosomal protein S17E
VTLSQLNIDNIDNLIRTNFEKIIKEIYNPIYTLFKIFIMNEIKEKYIKLLSNNIKQNFYEKFNKYFNEDKMVYCYKKSDILKLISNNINKCIDSLKAYSNYNLKNSVIKCFGDAFNQMLFKLERKTLNKFIDIFLYTLLFGELEINKQKTQKNVEELIKNNVRTKNNSQKKLYYGSSIKNNINNNPPFLPEINPKYKYALVLDMDETLVNFFFYNNEWYVFC